MISAEMMRDAEQRRLAWRCRRGMLELDIVLNRFVQEQFHTLTLEELDAFDELLTLPDNEFWSLIQSAKQHNNEALNHVIEMLNVTSMHHAREGQ